MRLAWLCILAACGGNGSSSSSIDARLPVDGLHDACRPTRHTIYLNRGGGTYTQGPDDSITNTSSVLTQTRVIAPATTVDADWTAVKSCVTAKLGPYQITITDVEPVVEHVEVVVLDNGNQIGAPGLTAGAPATPCAGGFGTAAKNTIAYAVWLGTNANRCWDMAMAIGYTLGLDNVLPCADLMSPNPSCDVAAKAFTGMDQQCGDTTARACRCGGQTQNAAARISENVNTSSCP
jgi:hypothetical protein